MDLRLYARKSGKGAGLAMLEAVGVDHDQIERLRGDAALMLRRVARGPILAVVAESKPQPAAPAYVLPSDPEAGA
ncbi:hypothetical protein [uncultured Aquabacterium sp.]|uniref:hypothetical protein n=1 Tax=uncultured Aquabacterium sp. TaxID=158753 RepID=UPI0025D58F91|nr:hypothetical protein [uncultured Aquabacterium sp.]